MTYNYYTFGVMALVPVLLVVLQHYNIYITFIIDILAHIWVCF